MPRITNSRPVVLDQWYAHESLDRMFLVMEMFNQYVLDHPFVDKTPHLKARAEKLSTDMMEMYQRIGSEYGDMYED